MLAACADIVPPSKVHLAHCSNLLPLVSNEVAHHFDLMLKCCKSLSCARQVHQQILALGLIERSSLPPSPPQSTLGVSIVASYLACGSATDAQLTLERLTLSPILWWNRLIQHYITAGHLHNALSMCNRMQSTGTKPDHFTLPFALKACGELTSYRRGSSFHSLACRSGFESNVFVCNALIAMYDRCGSVEEANLIFSELVSKGMDDVVSWNSIVAAHVKSGDAETALQLFARPERHVLSACDRASWKRSNVISIVNILPACASLKAIGQAKEIHAYVIRCGLFADVFVGNAMIDVYAKCVAMKDALNVFNMMEERDVISWNALVAGYSQSGDFDVALELFAKMRADNIPLNVVTWTAVIAGYAQRGHGHKALEIFRQMQLSLPEPNAVTVISILSACTSLGSLLHGKEIHAFSIKRRMITKHYDDADDNKDDNVVQNALIDMYSKCRSFNSARSMFDAIPERERTVVTWTVMIGGYAQFGDANTALKIFSRMVSKPFSVDPNAFTISCILMACASLSALRIGKQIHAYVLRHRFEAAMLFVGNCLIDMYAKSGDVDAARRVFGILSTKNSVSWTSLLTGYGIHGRGSDVLKVFDEMQKAGVVIDDITLLVLLYACSHSGMVEQGIRYFDDMSRVYGVSARAEHYACVIDLLGRAGRLDKAWETVQGMPMPPTAVVWVALLSACRVHNNVELAEYASTKLLEIDSDNDGTYTLLSNIYANAGRWKDVSRIRYLMKKSGIQKRPGWSSFQGKNATLNFFAGDRSHQQSEQIYALLGSLMERIKAIGYVPQTSFALHDVDDEEKTNLLTEHSEKLALAYGILTSSPGIPIRITKNLRVCGDCHSAFTYISKIVDHEIVLRDCSRFHHFKNGACSCGGYW